MTDGGGLSQRAARLVERLKTRRGRTREGLVLVEGVRAVDTALDGGAAVRFALVSPRLGERPEGAELMARLDVMGIDVRPVDDDVLGSVSDTETPQGVLMVCEERGLPVEELAAGRWLILDGVQDPGNAGTLLRAAAAFALDGVVALDGTVDLWSAKAVRASVGLVFRVPVVRCPTAAFLARARSIGLDLLVADAGGRDVGTLPGLAAFGLVVGNEGAGVRPEVAEAARWTVSVPMRGPAESLNVGIAGSILLYALSREIDVG